MGSKLTCHLNGQAAAYKVASILWPLFTFHIMHVNLTFSKTSGASLWCMSYASVLLLLYADVIQPRNAAIRSAESILQAGHGKPRPDATDAFWQSTAPGYDAGMTA